MTQQNGFDLSLFFILGTAGYGDDSWAIGQSYADDPVLTPVIYDPNAPAGQRFSSDGLQASEVPRMYHSSATLLPDGKRTAHDTIQVLNFLITALRLCLHQRIKPERGLYSWPERKIPNRVQD